MREWQFPSQCPSRKGDWMQSKVLAALLFVAGCTATVTTSPPPTIHATVTTPPPPPDTTVVTTTTTTTEPTAAADDDDDYDDEPSLAPVVVDLKVEPEGADVPAVDTFYDQLDPYGSWYDDPNYGWVFAPVSLTYVPYHNGHWKNTEFGWTWVSGDPFGWATDHYGRWVWANRWVWRPDTTWGPAWVQWRVSDSHIGWAPVGYDDDSYIPDDHWAFVPAVNITAPDVTRYYVTTNFHVYIHDSAPVRRYIKRHKIVMERQRYEISEIGRYNKEQRIEAERRAKEQERVYAVRRQREIT